MILKVFEPLSLNRRLMYEAVNVLWRIWHRSSLRPLLDFHGNSCCQNPKYEVSRSHRWDSHMVLSTEIHPYSSQYLPYSPTELGLPLTSAEYLENKIHSCHTGKERHRPLMHSFFEHAKLSARCLWSPVSLQRVSTWGGNHLSVHLQPWQYDWEWKLFHNEFDNTLRKLLFSRLQTRHSVRWCIVSGCVEMGHTALGFA